jgi:hypothetical protein
MSGDEMVVAALISIPLLGWMVWLLYAIPAGLARWVTRHDVPSLERPEKLAAVQNADIASMTAPKLERHLTLIRETLPAVLADSSRVASHGGWDVFGNPLDPPRTAGALAADEVRVLQALPEAWTAYAVCSDTPEFNSAVDSALTRLRAGVTT